MNDNDANINDTTTPTLGFEGEEDKEHVVELIENGQFLKINDEIDQNQDNDQNEENLYCDYNCLNIEGKTYSCL